MGNLEQKFFKTFNIGPCIKKGTKYINSVCVYQEKIAEEDIPWTINAEKILQLEEVLLSLDPDCHLEIYKEIHPEQNDFKETSKPVYHYVYVENDYTNPDDYYHHGFLPASNDMNKFITNRLDALLAVLIYYSYREDIYKEVRKVFGEE